ncbi:MAG: hypothetical protein ABL952_01090 [Pyrinomonadaceae bacterium]
MSDSKELELKERELALKEKELGLKVNGSKGSSKWKLIFTVLIVLLLLSAVGFLGADKLKQLGYLGTGNSKELELKEKELALKEKELDLKQRSSKESDPGKPGPKAEDSPLKAEKTSLNNLVYSELGMRNVYDRRVDSWNDVQAYVFSARYKDASTVEVMVNKEFGSIAAAEKEARFYSENIGKLPAALRRYLKTITIHKGTEVFGGGNFGVDIYTGEGAELIKNGDLENVLVGCLQTLRP